MARHVISSLDDFPADTRRVVEIDGVNVAVFNVDGQFHALKDECPHKGASLCTSPPTGMMMPSGPDSYEYGREGEIIRCPWHGYEFNLSNGRSVMAPEIKMRARVFEVEVENGEVAVYT